MSSIQKTFSHSLSSHHLSLFPQLWSPSSSMLEFELACFVFVGSWCEKGNMASQQPPTIPGSYHLSVPLLLQWSLSLNRREYDAGVPFRAKHLTEHNLYPLAICIHAPANAPPLLYILATTCAVDLKRVHAIGWQCGRSKNRVSKK